MVEKFQFNNIKQKDDFNYLIRFLASKALFKKIASLFYYNSNTVGINSSD